MLSQWIKKLTELFFEEIPDDQDDDYSKGQPQGQSQSKEIKKADHHKLNQAIQTRMTYQYPNKKPFDFPVIPDQPPVDDHPRRTDEPAFVRKQKGYKQPVEKSVKKHKEENTGYSNKKRPFQPTKVASPIYGYHEREMNKEREDIPAFVRKQKDYENKISNMKAELKDKETALESTLKEPVNPPSAKNEITEHTEERMNKATKESDKMDHPINKRHGAALEDIQPLPNESNNQPDQHKKSISGRQEKYTRPNRKSKTSEGTIPFNVMMSANDKRKHHDRVNSSNRFNHAAQNIKPQKKVHQTIPYYLLDDPKRINSLDEEWIQQQQELLEMTLKHFRVQARVVHATQGPTVTRFEVQPEMGVKVSKVKNLSDDLKLNMAARDIRIEAPIPGKNTIGIEIPNQAAQMVGLQEIIASDAFQSTDKSLTIGLGLTIEGAPLVTTIDKMPHGLIAGATGSGKSVCINTILISLIYKSSHEDVKFMLIDPKMVELAPYNGIPHLVAPVITDVKAATAALKWAVNEMEERYERFVLEGVRNIERYNQKMMQQNRINEKMPFLVIVIDELADLMMIAPHDVEDAISRIAQKARACGIHLLLATQRPSVDVITGLIKANIPTRIAFSVSSQVDSRTIMDTSGAEKLLGKGDMLFIENGVGKSVRLQGVFVSDEEIERVTKYARTIAPPDYLFEQDELLEQISIDDDTDELLDEALQFVVDQNSASTSLLQRHFKIGYNRAARLMDSMEAQGFIAGQNGSKPRDVLITNAQLESIQE